MPSNYTHARQGYLEWYSHLLLPPDTSDTPDDNHLNTLDLLADRLDGFTYASEELTLATQNYLQASQTAVRTAAVNALLLQIQGDLEIAHMVWQIVEENPDIDQATETVVRSVKDNRLKQTLRHLSVNMPTQLDSITPQKPPTTRTNPNPETALQDLQFEVENTIQFIRERTLTVGLRLVRDILSLGQGEWAAVLAGVDLLRGQQKVGDVGWGLEDQVTELSQGLATKLRGLLGTITNKLLLVIEKNEIIRYTIADWLEELRDTDPNQRKGRFESLLEQLYQSHHFLESDLPIWLQDAHQPELINPTTQRIREVGDNFEQIANQIRQLSSLLTVATLFLNPSLLAVGLGLQVGLLGTLIFAGYDHLDEGSRTLNITQGIKEILIEGLPVSPKTREIAENKRSRAVR